MRLCNITYVSESQYIASGALFTISSVAYPGHKLAKWDRWDESMGTFKSNSVLNDQIWRFEKDPSYSNNWMIFNDNYKNHKLAMWGTEQRNWFSSKSGTYSGQLNTDQFWKLSLGLVLK